MPIQKTDRRILKTKMSIRTALNQLILRKEFSSISIAEIAKLANIDRKTFYLHYDSVEDVLREYEFELAETVVSLLNANEKIEISSLFHGFNKIMTENIDLYSRASKATHYSFFLRRCKDILKSSIIESRYSNSSMPLNHFQVYAEYISSGIICIYTDWLNANNGLTLDELTEIAEDAVSHAWEKVMTQIR